MNGYPLQPALGKSSRKETMSPTPLRVNVYEFFGTTPELRIPERKDLTSWNDPEENRSVQWVSNEELVKQRLQQVTLVLRECIEVNSRRLGGLPSLKGTRFSIAQVLSQIGDGDSIEDLAENFDLDREQLATVLHAMAACFNRPLYR